MALPRHRQPRKPLGVEVEHPQSIGRSRTHTAVACLCSRAEVVIGPDAQSERRRTLYAIGEYLPTGKSFDSMLVGYDEDGNSLMFESALIGPDKCSR